MTRISFYVLSQSRPDASLMLACRLTDKALQQDHRIFVHCPQAAMCDRLDDLLWTFRQGSFIAHEREPDAHAPVILGSHPPAPENCHVLVNLGDEVPDCFSRFERVAELVTTEESARSAARSRYQFYRDRGYPLETHNIRS